MARSLDAHSLEGLSMNLQCPRCHTQLEAEAPACGQCSYDLAGLRLHDPSRFIWQSLLFSFAFPALLIADNWRRIGDRKQALGWVVASGGGFLFLIGLTAALPGLDRGGTILIASLINVPAALILGRSQRPMFRDYRSSGSSRVSKVREIVGGLFLALAYFLVSSVVIPAISF